MYSANLTTAVKANSTSSSSQIPSTIRIQIDQSKGPRWANITCQNTIFTHLVDRISEVFGGYIRQSLDLKSFLNLMVTCKEIYNLYIKFLPLSPSNLPPFLENFLIDRVVQDCQITRGDTTIYIKKDCGDVKIQFPEGHYFPQIRSNKDDLITVRKNKGPHCTLSAIAMTHHYVNAQYQFLSSLASSLQQEKDLFHYMILIADFSSFINITTVCKNLYNLRPNRIKQEAMIKFSLPELDGRYTIPDTDKLKFAQKYITERHTTIALSDLQKPSQFLINDKNLSFTLSIAKLRTIDEFIECISSQASLTMGQITIFENIKHLQLQFPLDKQALEKIYSLLKTICSNGDLFKQLTKLSLNSIFSIPDFSHFKIVKNLYIESLNYIGIDNHRTIFSTLPSSITNLSFGCLNQDIDFSIIPTSRACR